MTATSPLRVVTVVGARPQFIKAAPLSRALRAAGHAEFLVHTGQHYDAGMSQVFFDELGIPAPDANLSVGSSSHGRQTALMLTGIEEVLIGQQPDALIVYGDTNSTLAGALAAAKLHIPIAHVEAGLRSFNRTMPEEVNRVLTDHLSSLLWTPGETAVANLRREGIVTGVEIVGDIMADALAASVSDERTAAVLGSHGLARGQYFLVTVHRAENTTAEPLERILTALESLPHPTVLPLHPRTRAVLESLGRKVRPPVRIIEPVGHMDMMALVGSARMVLTDSGGLQKEAYWLQVPCITLREETEWVETVDAGWNVLAGTDPSRIADAVGGFRAPAAHPVLYGDGHAAVRCVQSLERSL